MNRKSQLSFAGALLSALLVPVTLLAMALGLAACGAKVVQPGSYAIPGASDIMHPCATLHADGTFVLMLSPISSYVAVGTYSQKGKTLTLQTDDGLYTYVFTVDDDALVLDLPASHAGDTYDVADGARFVRSK